MTRLERQRKQIVNRRKDIIFFVLTITICFSLWNYRFRSEEAVAVNGTSLLSVKSETATLPKWKDVLGFGLPGMQSITTPQTAVTIKSELTTQQMLREILLLFSRLDIKDIRSFFYTEIPVMSVVSKPSSVVSAMNLYDFPKFESKYIALGEKPIVGIYHTHTAESFVPSSGVAHRPGGQKGDIVEIGAALAKRLETYGIPTIQSSEIHDYPSFMKAYGASEITVKKMLSENPSLQMVFDIHRDADKRDNCIATVGDGEVAKILIIVATGQPDLIQPHWQQNHAFAKLIDAKLNQMYPGVSRGIQLVDWRYNQHLHPRALLIEIGCQENSKEEAQRSVEILGDVIAEIVKEYKE